MIILLGSYKSRRNGIIHRFSVSFVFITYNPATISSYLNDGVKGRGTTGVGFLVSNFSNRVVATIPYKALICIYSGTFQRGTFIGPSP